MNTYEIALRWIPHTSDVKSTLVQVIPWYHQATRHHLNQCWPTLMSLYGIPRPQWVIPCRAKFISKHIKNMFTFSIIYQYWDLWELQLFPVENKNPFILRSQYHCYWWSGDKGRQDISSYDIVLTQFDRNIPVSAREGSTLYLLQCFEEIYIIKYLGQVTKLRLSCYLVLLLIAKPGNKTAAVSWPDPSTFSWHR